MDVADHQKRTMHRYLRDERDGLLSKLDGLGDYDLRRPLTPTGTNLLGVVKHVASVGLDYFTITFGRPRGRDLPWFEEGAEPDADLYATPDETSAEIIDLYRFAADAADATITELPLDAPGEVPWWSEGRRAVTLHRILVHMTVETARHAGHVDIVRELVDGAIGQKPGDQMVTHRDGAGWSDHYARVDEAARAFLE